MNELFLLLGVERLKPLFTALLLPPLPFLLLAGVALLLLRKRRRLGAMVLGASLALVWLSACIGVGEALTPLALPIPPPLGPARLDALRKQAGGPVAIIVLGGGVEEWAPEYGASSLQFRSLERLRYGLWLSRRTGWPVGFSGGLGWAQPPGSAREAAVAQRIATDEFRQPLRWVEANSRDTRENARLMIALLKPMGIRQIVLVTHAVHMPRAIRNFVRAGGPDMLIEAASIGLSQSNDWPLLQWVPTGEGLSQVRALLREWLGMVSGA